MGFFGATAGWSNIGRSADVPGTFHFSAAASPAVLAAENGEPLMAGVVGSPLDSPPSSNAAQRLRAVDVALLEKLPWAAWQFVVGVAGPLPWNAGLGTPNDISEQVRCKVASASGTSLTLRGPHPLRCGFVVATPNPDWPGEGPKFFTAPTHGAIPLGAEVRFGWPSVLAGKLIPVITAISAPAWSEGEVTWTATVSADVSEALTPVDAAIEADDYPCDLFFYRTAAPLPTPDAWQPHVRGWIGRSWSFSRVEVPLLDEDGCVELTGTDGERHAKVLTRSLEVAGRTVGRLGGLVWQDLAGEWHDASDEFDERLRVDRVAGEWRSRLYLGDIYEEFAGTAAAARFALTWFAVMVEGDDHTATAGLRVAAQCANARPASGYSGVTGADAGIACHAMEDATGFAAGRFHAECWIPAGLCDRFAPVRTDGTVGGAGAVVPGVLEGGGDLWDRLTVASDVWFVEYASGSTVPAFSVERVARGQASLTTLAGPWGEITRGRFPHREPLVFAPFGRRVTFTNDSGEHQALVKGAWWQRSWSDGEEAQDAFDAAAPSSAERGLFARAVDFTVRTPPTGVTYPPAVPEVDPFLPPHTGGSHLYTGAVRAANPANRVVAVADSRKVSRPISAATAPDAALVAWVAERVATT